MGDNNNEEFNVQTFLTQQQELFRNMEQTLMKSFDEKFASLLSTIEKTQTTASSALQRADDNDKRISELEKNNALLKTDVENLTRQVGELLKVIDVRAVQVSTLTTRLEHQTNRNSRSSVTIRGIEEVEGGEKTWEETRKVVCNKIASITKCDPQKLSGAIERIHRGKASKRGGPRVVHALFSNWNDSELLKNDMWKRGRNSGVFVEQRYGPDTTWRRNQGLTMRRELKQQGTITSGFLAYPAKLMVKYQRTEKNYTLHKDFSNEPIILTR